MCVWQSSELSKGNCESEGGDTIPSKSNQAEPLNQVEALERIHLSNQEGTENGQGAVNDAPDKRNKAANFDMMNRFSRAQ